LTGAYLLAAAAAAGLLVVSVALELLFRVPAVDLPKSSLRADNPDPHELVACNRSVRHLLDGLAATTSELVTAPLRDREVELEEEWKHFSSTWRDEWDVVNAQCRFRDLAETNMGEAYDQMAQVHGDLPSMRLRFQSLLVRFDDEQTAELAEMTRALDQSYAVLLQRTAAPEGTPAGQQ